MEDLRRGGAAIEARVVQREQEVGVRGDGDHPLRSRHQPAEEAVRMLADGGLVYPAGAVGAARVPGEGPGDGEGEGGGWRVEGEGEG